MSVFLGELHIKAYIRSDETCEEEELCSDAGLVLDFDDGYELISLLTELTPQSPFCHWPTETGWPYDVIEQYRDRLDSEMGVVTRILRNRERGKTDGANNKPAARPRGKPSQKSCQPRGEQYKP